MVTGSTYVITGGLGGLGLRAMALLFEGGATGVVLSSRSGRAADGWLKAHPTAVAGVVSSDVADAVEALCLLTHLPFHL